jgi:hypothetical protein
MSAPMLCFDDPNRPDRVVAVDPDPQTVVRAGAQPHTATVISPDGTMTDVRGEVADVHLQIQAAAARSHEGGDTEVVNTPMN